jgi:hypothetical protein
LISLTLFMLGVRADHHDATLAFDNLAFFADRLNRRSYFHLKLPYLPLGFSLLERQVMRPLERSYGEISTVTLSPGKIRMKFIRSLPEMCAAI